MQRDHAKAGALSPTGIQRNGGGFIDNEVRAKSYYTSLADKEKAQLNAAFKDYQSDGGKLNFFGWIAQERWEG